MLWHIFLLKGYLPCIAVVAMEFFAFLVFAMEPCEELEMTNIVVVMALVKFVVHVVVVKVLEEFIVAQVVVVKVLEGFFVPIIVAIVTIVDRKFVVAISFGIPTFVLITLVVWKKELIVVGVVVDNSWACQVDLECVACLG